MSKLKFKVSQDDIEEGIPMFEDSCPIALAVQKLPGVVSACVDDVEVQVEYKNGKFKSFKVTPSGKKFIHDFDLNLPVTPIKFCFREVL